MKKSILNLIRFFILTILTMLFCGILINFLFSLESSILYRRNILEEFISLIFYKFYFGVTLTLPFAFLGVISLYKSIKVIWKKGTLSKRKGRIIGFVLGCIFGLLMMIFILFIFHSRISFSIYVFRTIEVILISSTIGGILGNYFSKNLIQNE